MIACIVLISENIKSLSTSAVCVMRVPFSTKFARFTFAPITRGRK